jgi:hypothetical protein
VPSKAYRYRKNADDAREGTSAEVEGAEGRLGMTEHASSKNGIWVEELKKVREALVAIRREFTRQAVFRTLKAASLANLDEALEAGDALQRLQEQIEAVDRAIEDEEQLTPAV